MARRPGHRTFYEVLTEAVSDIVDNGFDSMARIQRWVEAIRQAAVRGMVSNRVLEQQLRNTLGIVYKRMVDKGGIFQYHVGVPKFTLDKVKPKLRAELDRRIANSTNLIKLNKEQAVDATLRRFQGWATSIPAGGSDAADKAEIKAAARKPLANLSFEERRVAIDQGHKLISAINDIVAQDAGAIAAVWHSNWRQKNYNYRKDHKDRDEKVYLIRDSWAHKKGLVKPGPAGYFDTITKPGEEVFCRCSASFLYAVSRLPDDMITNKGHAEIQRAADKLKDVA